MEKLDMVKFYPLPHPVVICHKAVEGWVGLGDYYTGTPREHITMKSTYKEQSVYFLISSFMYFSLYQDP